MVHNKCESFLHIYYDHFWLYSKDLILLNESMLPCTFHITYFECVTSRMSHISFVEVHWDTLNNSSKFKAEFMIFIAIQSNWAFLLSTSFHFTWAQPTKPAPGSVALDPCFVSLSQLLASTFQCCPYFPFRDFDLALFLLKCFLFIYLKKLMRFKVKFDEILR